MTLPLLGGLLFLGILAGVASGLIGIGGGIIIVPALVMFFGFSQHMAQGTTLMLMIPPIGILAVASYYKQGFVDMKVAVILIVGFVIGGWLGAKMAMIISENLLKKLFAVLLLVIAAKMLFFEK